jgi:hypothetical protein
MEEPNAGKAGIPIVVGILVGLLASFVQSLGKLFAYIKAASGLQTKQGDRLDNTKEKPPTERYPSPSATKEDLSETVSDIPQQEGVREY